MVIDLKSEILNPITLQKGPTMFKKIILFLVLILSGLALYAAVKPADMFVARDIVINAPPEIIFPHINDSKKANDWMPWRESDPNVVMQYSGPEEGVGAKSSWDSKGKMGAGEALVIESVPNQTVKTQLIYTRPFTMSQLAEISFTPVEDGTKVTWSVKGQQNFFFRFIGIFMDCDKMIGGEFNKGLANLKKTVEASWIVRLKKI
jgi:hypothetical protein